MSNKERVWYPNTTHHITIRENSRNDIFRDEEEFEVYLAQLEGNIEYYNNDYEILCYCLMDNHVHLLLHTYDKHMKFFMKRINSIYTRYFNDKYNDSNKNCPLLFQFLKGAWHLGEEAC